MSNLPQIECLTDELRQLVGRGVWTARVLTLPTLRELSRVDRLPRMSARHTTSAIRNHLLGAIKTFGDAEFQGDQVSGDTMRRVFRVLLNTKRTNEDAETRRGWALWLLKLNYPVRQMRRPDSPERELLRLLAIHLVESSSGHQPGDQSAA
jgi:hypothetical protein